MEDEIQQMTAIYEMIVTYLVTYSFQIIGAVIVLLIGILIARKVSNFVLKLCERKKLDITLSRFAANTVKILIIVMVAVIALGQLGISVTPMVAAIGALGLGAGLAVQGLLSNYGAGLNIILARPFVLGDTIEVNGVKGVVREIHLAYTLLADEDNVQILVPNRHIVGEIIHNSQADSLVELTVGIAYHCQPEQAIEVIRKALSSVPGISHVRQPLIGIHQFGDSSIDIGIRLWALTERLYESRYSTNLAIHRALAEAGIEIPFPQRDVRISNSVGTPSGKD
ncbi:mechanosensitive ion channel family protein [Pseudohongiella spirulinae]|uniref:Small-conductance mechanosensitive channel n=1 Tax=Pseudohongiella spirulinae TaxID=1249552 RepID=A0A0S2KA55_9GAMM|nr:mechanosensitive ion channel family protein [Pseudohongiella spirulinae]ALO45245.1 Mechanosensitive ion channel family protein [Pseudohongiella spirulinae]